MEDKRDSLLLESHGTECVKLPWTTRREGPTDRLKRWLLFYSGRLAFFGGSTADYASTALTHTFYKNWQFYEGDEASTMEGESVVASVGT